MNRLVAFWTHSLNRNEKIILISVFTILLLRLASVGVMGLMPQDAYYFYVYGEHLSLSYFDHPPLIGYLLRLSTELFGKTVFAIKLADTLVTALTVLSFYKLSLYFLSPHKARRTLLLLFSTFMVTILSLVSTPDVPLMLFWSLSLIMLYNAVFLQKKIYWLWAGIMMGLAFDSKYTGALLPAGLIVFLVLSRQHRKKLLSAGLWLSMLIFLITILPVVIWNVQNHFASFRFQSAERMDAANGLKFTPLNFAGLIGHQAAILTPILFFALVFFLFRATRKYIIRGRKIPPETLFLLSFFVPIFIGFIAVSFIYWVKLNWLMPAYITGIILAGKFFSEKWVKYQVIFSLIIHAALAVEIFFYPVQVKSDDTWFGWKTLAKKVEQIHHKNPAAFVFSADENKTSSILNFYSDSMVYSQNIIGENALHFDYIGTNLNTLQGKDAYFINSIPNFKTETRENKFPDHMKPYFDSITEMDPILIKNHKRTMRKFLVFYCTNYHPKKIHVYTTRVEN
ncbi:MAG: glycosyltransferase family 39 protein [Chitinophagaceae bacterium]|nr:glycosyltransferase family 39 protein [Chitinophagaceae bacterium]